MKIKNILLILVRLFLAGVFIYAAAGKIANPAGFANEVDNYRMLPYILVTLMAAILPWVEMICGLMLLLGKWVRGTSVLIIIMNVVFIIAISSAMARGLDIECGCFKIGGEGAKVGFIRLIEDFIFLAGAAILYYFYSVGQEQMSGIDNN
ncbi:DoxX family membrane protein [candidate division KSB1 bacterium]|nr:DoxX family membrane protein [candidate division KSB1 bacterium]